MLGFNSCAEVQRKRLSVRVTRVHDLGRRILRLAGTPDDDNRWTSGHEPLGGSDSSWSSGAGAGRERHPAFASA
jgi:hypothetical protein